MISIINQKVKSKSEDDITRGTIRILTYFELKEKH